MLIPGMPMMVPSAAGGGFAFEMTVEAPLPGYYSDSIFWNATGGFAEDNWGDTYGSASGDFVAGGGTVTECGFQILLQLPSNTLGIKDGDQSATNVNVDGSDYLLTFDGTYSGMDVYTFGPSSSLFADGLTYQITVT